MLTTFALLIGIICSAMGLAGQALENPTRVVWEIGGRTAPEGASWMSIGRGLIGQDRVIVSDAHLPSVRAFGLRDGELLATYGSEGKGPAEHERPGAVAFVGDSVRVHDFLQSRWSFFSLDGIHLRTSTAGHPPVHLRWGAMGEGGVGRGMTEWRDAGDGKVARAVVFWDEASVDTVASFSMNHVFFQWSGLPQWRSTQFGIGPAGDAVALGDTLVAVVDGNRGTLSLWGAIGGRGVQVRSITLEERGRKISRLEQDWIIDRVEEELGGLHPRWEDRLMAPESWSAWTEILNGSDGTVWLRRGGPEFAFSQGDQVWHQVALASGSVVGQITLDSKVRLIAVRGQLALTVRRDDLDVEYLQLREIG